MGLKNVLNYVPVVGPIANLRFLPAHARRIRSLINLDNPNPKILQGLTAYQQDAGLRALVNTISHLFFAAVCLIPAVAKCIPAVTPWVFVAGSVVSVIHLVACYVLHSRVVAKLGEIEATRLRAEEKRVALIGALGSLAWAEAHAQGLPEPHSNWPSPPIKLDSEVGVKYQAAKKVLQASPDHAKRLEALFSAIEQSFREGKNYTTDKTSSKELLKDVANPILTYEEIETRGKSLEALLTGIDNKHSRSKNDTLGLRDNRTPFQTYQIWELYWHAVQLIDLCPVTVSQYDESSPRQLQRYLKYSLKIEQGGSYVSKPEKAIQAVLDHHYIRFSQAPS